MRIVSLLPGATEIVCSLGLAEQLVGVTHECDYPAPVRALPKVILAARPGWSVLPCVRDDRVYVVDGSTYFSRPGPRLVDGLEILAQALQPARSFGAED